MHISRKLDKPKLRAFRGRRSAADDAIDPGGEGIEKRRHHFLVGGAALRGHVKGMVGMLEQSQRGALAEAFAERSEQRNIGERIMRPLQEEHGDADLGEVCRALVGRLARRMEREAEKGEAAHAGQRALGLRLRGHAAAEGFAAGNQRQLRCKPRRFGNRGADGGVRDPRRIGTLAALLHIGELVAERGDRRGLRAPRRPSA